MLGKRSWSPVGAVWLFMMWACSPYDDATSSLHTKDAKYEGSTHTLFVFLDGATVDDTPREQDATEGRLISKLYQHAVSEMRQHHHWYLGGPKEDTEESAVNRGIEVERDICAFASSPCASSVEIVAVGISRGAFIEIELANRLRTGNCNVSMRGLLLVDPVGFYRDKVDISKRDWNISFSESVRTFNILKTQNLGESSAYEEKNTFISTSLLTGAETETVVHEDPDSEHNASTVQIGNWGTETELLGGVTHREIYKNDTALKLAKEYLQELHQLVQQ